MNTIRNTLQVWHLFLLAFVMFASGYFKGLHDGHPVDTSSTFSGGVDGLSLNGSMLNIDATYQRVGVGTSNTVSTGGVDTIWSNTIWTGANAVGEFGLNVGTAAMVSDTMLD